MKQYISEIFIGIILFLMSFLLMCWILGFMIAFLGDGECNTGRIIVDNWVTGLGYQLSCKR